jgi:hypothetical protein
MTSKQLNSTLRAPNLEEEKGPFRASGKEINFRTKESGSLNFGGFASD